VPLHHLQRIAQLVQLGFTFLVGKQTGLDNEKLRQIRGPATMPDWTGFFEVPKSDASPPRGLCDAQPSQAKASRITLKCSTIRSDATPSKNKCG
jgi:hypothetical protein